MAKFFQFCHSTTASCRSSWCGLEISPPKWTENRRDFQKWTDGAHFRVRENFFKFFENFHFWGSSKILVRKNFLRPRFFEIFGLVRSDSNPNGAGRTYFRKNNRFPSNRSKNGSMIRFFRPKSCFHGFLVVRSRVSGGVRGGTPGSPDPVWGGSGADPVTPGWPKNVNQRSTRAKTICQIEALQARKSDFCVHF